MFLSQAKARIEQIMNKIFFHIFPSCHIWHTQPNYGGKIHLFQSPLEKVPKLTTVRWTRKQVIPRLEAHEFLCLFSDRTLAEKGIA